MCGITAIFAYDDRAPDVDPAEMERINQAMINRGPDGEGSWMTDDRRLGLAHRRLAIIDPSPAGAQPMVLDAPGASQRRLVISYNGEIYNFQALRTELEAEGRQFHTHSDTEVILQLYDRDGPAMVSKLRGMFAIALWDDSKRELFLARDPFGIKPLYFADDGRTIRVASQVKALKAGGAIDTAPDPAATVGYFMLGSVPEPHTIYRGVALLEAGHWMLVGPDGRSRSKRYFDPRDHLPPHGQNDGHLGEALVDTVRHHMVSDVPVGVFLSAGLDSATVAAHAAAMHGASLDSLTLGFREYAGRAMDEVPLAEEIAQLYGTRHQTKMVSAEDFRDHFGNVLTAMDQPSLDGVNTYFVAKAAAETGLKVALSGVGGDELFGGYDTFSQVPSMVSRLGWLPGLRPLGAGFRVLTAPLLKRLASPKWASLFEYGGDYPGAYLLRRGLYLPWELPEFLDPDLVRDGLRSFDLMARLSQTVDGVALGKPAVSALETSWYLRNQLLRDADWAGMAHSLEIRTPLVDAQLFASVAALGATKQDMARTPAKPLPDAVLNRPKTGFLVPVREWVMGDPDVATAERGYRTWAKTVFDRSMAA